MTLQGTPAAEIAHELESAWRTRTPVEPLTERGLLGSTEEAYAAQAAWTGLRETAGDRTIGRKIGLTSPAMQRQMGVNEPDFGSLWESRFFPAQGRRTDLPTGEFVQPRVEGELAFLLARRLEGPGVTIQAVLAATEAVAVAVEVVDSRVADWRIKLFDTIADNASYGAFTLGPWSAALRASDLRTVGMTVHRNGQPVSQALGAAALGHPAAAVAWLANKLGSFGVALEAGDIVLSGSLAGAEPAARDDVFALQVTGQPPLTVRFT